MTNPFDDPQRLYVVLANDEGQHSLWPAETAVPAGWAVVHDEAGRDDCLSYVEANWIDMRPASLVRAMAADYELPPLRGESGDADYFTVKEPADVDTAAVVDVLEGHSAGVIFRGFLGQAACVEVASRFWSSPARRARGVEAPGYYVGAYHYHKPTATYLHESAEAQDAVDAILRPVEADLARFWEQLGTHPASRGVTVRRARHASGTACSWLIRSWHGRGDYALAPHEDRSQCGEPQQADFEIQGVLDHEVAALNICIENGEGGGRLAVWNVRPDEPTKRALGLHYTGSPYPVETLRGIEYQHIEVRPGDAYVISGANVHAVESGHNPDDRRTTLACLFGFIDDSTVASWT